LIKLLSTVSTDFCGSKPYNITGKQNDCSN